MVQEYLAIATFAIAIAAIVYQVGQLAQLLTINTRDINNLGNKVDQICDRLNALERDVY